MSDQTDMNRGFLKEKLGNYQADPPEKVWNTISGQIGNGRKRRGMYILLLATAASIALAVTLGMHFFGPDLPQVEEGATEMDLCLAHRLYQAIVEPTDRLLVQYRLLVQCHLLVQYR